MASLPSNARSVEPTPGAVRLEVSEAVTFRHCDLAGTNGETPTSLTSASVTPMNQVMVELRFSETALLVRVLGLHKLWALKAEFTVPLTSLRRVRRMKPAEITGLWKGWRLPGTHLPGLFVAGTYYTRGERHFWDVRDATHAIAIELCDGAYDRLFVEVRDPESAIEDLRQAGATFQS